MVYIMYCILLLPCTTDFSITSHSSTANGIPDVGWGRETP